MSKSIRDLAQAVLDYNNCKIEREELCGIYNRTSKQPMMLCTLVNSLLKETMSYGVDDELPDSVVDLVNNTVKEARIILKSEPLIAPTMPLAELADKPAQLSGGVNDYYSVTLANGDVVECKDVIRALGLHFDQGNIMKSLWRDGKKPDSPAIRDKEKIVYSACEELFAAAGVNGVSARRALLVKLLGW